MLKINDVELELDLMDADIADKVEKAIKNIDEREKNIKREGIGLGDIIRQQYNLIFDFFNEVFGATVWIRKLATGNHSFDVFRAILNAINGGRRRKDNLFNASLAHAFEKIDSTAYIVLVVFEWFLDGFADGFKPCKMYNCVNIVFAENLIKSCSVADIGLIEFKILACDFFDSVKALGLTVIKVI